MVILVNDMIDTMPKRHPRDRVIILLSTKRRKVEKEDPCPDLKLEKEVDDLESISGTSENHVVEEEGTSTQVNVPESSSYNRSRRT